MTPLVPEAGGGDHDREMAREFKLTPARFCGATLGAVGKMILNSVYCYKLMFILLPASSVCTVIALLNGPLPALVAAAIEQSYTV